MISTAEEARRAMDACLYPPAGTRGFGPRRACRYGRQALPDYIKGAEDVTARLCQIESVTAVRNLDELLTVPGVDGFILGPCDLSGTVGHLNDIFHPDVLTLVDEVIAKCRAAGKPIGIAVGADSAEDVRFWHDRGVQFISAGSDIATCHIGSVFCTLVFLTLGTDQFCIFKIIDPHGTFDFRQGLGCHFSCGITALPEHLINSRNILLQFLSAITECISELLPLLCRCRL